MANLAPRDTSEGVSIEAFHDDVSTWQMYIVELPRYNLGQSRGLSSTGGLHRSDACCMSQIATLGQEIVSCSLRAPLCLNAYSKQVGMEIESLVSRTLDL